MFSFGIEPSITSTNGASSSSSSAWRNGLRNSSPPSVGESTLLCRWTFGRPGIAPSSTSSMPGWPAAVIETVSPSQLIPSEIQRMWTSSTPGAIGSAVILRSLRSSTPPPRARARRRAAPRRAAARGPGRRRPRTPAGSPGSSLSVPQRRQRPGGGDLLHHQLGALELRALRDAARTRTRARRARPGAGARPSARPRATGRPAACRARDRDDRLGERELVHQWLAISRSSAAGRRRAGPSPACRRTRSRPAPCRAARS